MLLSDRSRDETDCNAKETRDDDSEAVDRGS